LLKNHKKIHGVLWIGLSQAILLLGNFVVLKLLTVSLSVADFGYYSLCMTFILFARQVIYDPFSMVIAKYCSVNDSDKKTLPLSLQVIRYSAGNVGIVVCILSLVFFVFEFFVVGDIRLSPLFFSCLIYLFANGAQGVYINIFNSIGDRRRGALFSIIDSFFKVSLISLVCKLFVGDLILGLASVSAAALSALFFIQYLIRLSFLEIKSNLNEIEKTFREFFVNCLPLFFPSLLNALKNVGDRWILAGFMGVDDLAGYTVLLQIGYFPVVLFFGIVQTYMGPFIYKLCSLKSFSDRQYVKKLVLQIIIASIFLGLVFFGITAVLDSWVLDILVGPSYGFYAKYLSIFVFAGSLGVGASILQLIAFGVFDTKASSKLISTSMGLSLLLFLLSVYFFSFEGAVGGLVFAGLVPMMIFSLSIYKRLTRLGA